MQGVHVELTNRDAAIEWNGIDIIQFLADRPGLHVQADILPVREDRGVKFETHRLVQTHIVRPQVELSHLKIRPGLLVRITNIAILDIEESDQEQQGRGRRSVACLRCLLRRFLRCARRCGPAQAGEVELPLFIANELNLRAVEDQAADLDFPR